MLNGLRYWTSSCNLNPIRKSNELNARAVRTLTRTHHKLATTTRAVRDRIPFSRRRSQQLLRLFHMRETDAQLLSGAPINDLLGNRIENFMLQRMLKIENESTHKLSLSISRQHARNDDRAVVRQ